VVRRIIGTFLVDGNDAKEVPFMLLRGYDGSSTENGVSDLLIGVGRWIRGSSPFRAGTRVTLTSRQQDLLYSFVRTDPGASRPAAVKN